MKQKYISLLSIWLFLLSLNLFAAPPIRNAELLKAVAKAEILFNNGEFVEAAETYLAALSLENFEAQKEVEEIKEPFICPYSLILHYERLNCLQKARKRRTEIFKIECQKVLEKYKDQAKGKNWNEYMMIYEHLMRHYRVNKNKEMVLKTYDEAVNYNLWHNNTCYYIDYLIQIAPNPIDEKTISKIEVLMEKYKQTAGKLSSGMAHRKLFLKKRMGEDVFDDAIEFLKTYPNTVFGEIRSVIIIARDAISFDKPEQIKQYYNALIVLAIKQSGTKENFATIAFLVNEKKKLETIMPEVKR